MEWIWLAAQFVAVFALSTFLFDCVHWILHRWTNARFAPLRFFARLHQTHHAFLDRGLRVHEELKEANYWHHVVPEYVTSFAGTLLLGLVFPAEPVAMVLALQTVLFCYVTLVGGEDLNHMNKKRVAGNFGNLYVSDDYHALHHVFPGQFYSSYINLFDMIFGKSCQFERRAFLVTGASGAFGSAMAAELARRGGLVETLPHADYAVAADAAGGMALRLAGDAAEKLRRAEVLVLAHGVKGARAEEVNTHSFVLLIEHFRRARAGGIVPGEVWAVGSEAELHGDLGLEAMRDYARSKRAFARHAHDYYRSKDILYRHIVPSAFTSPMGRGLMSARSAVGMALFFISRGFRYVPVTYTGLALLNYFRFRLQRPPGALAPASPEQPSMRS